MTFTIARYQPRSIDLYHFIDAWLVGMKKDNMKASIFLSM
ncbi:DUF2750 domain-containing protein [uncultured Brevibacillus sp.]